MCVKYAHAYTVFVVRMILALHYV